jgi:hypothetical protein
LAAAWRLLYTRGGGTVKNTLIIFVAGAALTLGAMSSALSPMLGRAVGTAAAAAPLKDEISRTVSKEVAPLADEAQVDLYLAELIARAEKKREVTPLEVAPGLRAIKRLAGRIPNDQRIKKELAFVDKMSALESEFAK